MHVHMSTHTYALRSCSCLSTLYLVDAKQSLDLFRDSVHHSQRCSTFFLNNIFSLLLLSTSRIVALFIIVSPNLDRGGKHILALFTRARKKLVEAAGVVVAVVTAPVVAETAELSTAAVVSALDSTNNLDSLLSTLTDSPVLLLPTDLTNTFDELPTTQLDIAPPIIISTDMRRLATVENNGPTKPVILMPGEVIPSILCSWELGSTAYFDFKSVPEEMHVACVGMALQGLIIQAWYQPCCLELNTITFDEFLIQLRTEGP